MEKKGWKRDVKRLALVVIASCVMAMNIKSFVRAGGLFPGGFTGLTLLIQQTADKFFHIVVPYSAVNLLLNLVPIIISFRFIGKKFTLYSCLAIVLTSILTDVLPGYPITSDILLICVFGGLINGFAISLCLFADATSGGTDFIAIFFSERKGKETWNYILAGNVLMLVAAGFLLSWEQALYSIIFQFTSTQILNGLYSRYQKLTLLIITEFPQKVYEQIKSVTHHDATLFQGVGCYEGKERNLLYSVVSRQEKRRIVSEIREIDPKAFINVVKTEQVTGRFYLRPND